MDRYEKSRLIGHLIKRAQHTIRQAMDDALRPLGLTTPQFVAMCNLAECSGISNADLSRKCFVTPQTMNVIISALQKGGYLARASHETHGRIQRISLTAAGEALLARADELILKVENRTFKVFTLEELGQLSRLMEKFPIIDD